MKFETIFIADTNCTEAEIKKVINKFTTYIKENGELEEIQDWGNKKLAYPIKKHTEGRYILINFISDYKFIEKLEKTYQEDKNIIKFITVKTETEEE